jgi:hypothetical protein
LIKISFYTTILCSITTILCSIVVFVFGGSGVEAFLNKELGVIQSSDFGIQHFGLDAVIALEAFLR